VSGDSEQHVVGSARMLAEPIRLQSDYGTYSVIFLHDFCVERMTRFIVDMNYYL